VCVIYLSSNCYIKQDAISFDERSILHPFTEVVLGKTVKKRVLVMREVMGSKGRE